MVPIKVVAMFDPSAPSFTEPEIVGERRAILREAGIAADAAVDDESNRTISLFDEATGELLGRLSDAEFAVLQRGLERERPDDDDYWINSEEIEDIAGSPGATPHLVALLRRAVGSNPDGVDIRFEREGRARQQARSEPDMSGDEA